MDRVKIGNSLFFTGDAGAGKSFLVERIIADFKLSLTHDQIAITAPTGIAARKISGITLHAFAGTGIQTKRPFKEILDKIKSTRGCWARWMRIKVLVIDEGEFGAVRFNIVVSMVDPDFLDLLERLGRSLRGSELAFGGIQVIVTGDFCQLPPVAILGKDIRYAFSSSCWNSLFKLNSFVLTKVFRQSGDTRLIAILQELRSGSLSPESINILRSECMGKDEEYLNGDPMLFPLNKDVDKANKRCLDAIAGDEYKFQANRNTQETS